MASSATEASALDARATGASRPARSAKRPRRYSAAQRILFVIALVTFTFASVYSGLVLFARAYPALFPGQSLGITVPLLDKTPLAPIQSGGEDSVFNERINLLVLGLDKRPYEPMEGAYLTDSIMVATVDPVSRKASALSIPRDIMIGHYQMRDGQCVWLYDDRVNTSYSIGWNQGQSIDAAAHKAMTDISCEFGIELDHYVVIDFIGVENLVDAVGGVDLDIPEDLTVPRWLYSDEGDRPERYISFEAGLQHVDGYHAVAFGRHREDSDLNRARRQQLVLQAAVSKALGLGWLSSPGKIADVWGAYKSLAVTDVPNGKVPGLGLLMKQGGGQIAMYSLGDKVNGIPTLYDDVLPSGAQVLVYDEDNVQTILNQVFTQVKYADSYVEVQNGYSNDEYGERRVDAVARLLLHEGLPTVYAGDDIAILPTTQIILLDPNREQMANDIAAWLGLDPSAIVPGTKELETDPEIIVKLGSDFELPTE